MAEHTQPWGDRTVDMSPPPADPWAQQPPAPVAAPNHGSAPAPGPTAAPWPAPAFQRGVAHVRPTGPRHTETMPVAPHEPTGTGWPGGPQPQPRMPLGVQLRQLRRGGGWTTVSLSFAFVGWAVWALSSSGDFAVPVLILVLSLLVAGGVFALARLVGRVVLERHFGRVRRTAQGAHLVTAVFLVGFGLACLRQTGWVMSLWGWILGLF